MSESATKDLLEAVRAGRSRDVPALLKPLTAAERKTCLAELKTLRAEVRGWSWQRWQERGKVNRALLPAGAACQTGAAATAAWIGARDLRTDRPLHSMLVELLSDRDAAWIGDVAHRLAGRASTAQEDYPLISELVRVADCPLPTTAGYVQGWAEAAVSARGKGLARLGEDPQARTLAPCLFDLPELPREVLWYDDPDAPDHWPSALCALVEQGQVERAVLVDACVARVLRGGRPGELRFLLVVLRRLALTAEEERDRVADWIGMAADGASTAAAYAQGVLARLAESGWLSTRALSEMSASVLFRAEKKLVRAQLVLLGKALRRDARCAAELLPVLAEAFGHVDVGVQERALKLVGRHLSAVDEALREELAASAELLSPVHRAAAVEIFGALPAEDGGAYEEMLPPPPQRRRLAPAPDSVAELVEDVVVLVRSHDEAGDVERTLDGLVRLAYREREALAEALRAALAGSWWLSDSAPWSADDRFSAHPHGVEAVVAALLERVSVETLDRCRSRPASADACVHRALSVMTDSRLWEAAYLVRVRPVPFLLATPTWHTGALDAGELVERLREYERLGAVPGPMDFGQALLRVRRGEDVAAAEAAARLGTTEGDRLAAWILDEDPAMPALRTDSSPDSAPLRAAATVRRRLTEIKERRSLQRAFPQPFHWLGRPWAVPSEVCYHATGRSAPWPAALPHHGESLAAWLLPAATAGAQGRLRGGAWFLPVLAEADGPAGPALHHALAAGLGARHADDRLAAVDTLLVLAARGRLDGEELGRRLGELVACGTVKPNRLAESLRTAAATGAYGTTWSVLAPALAGLLTAGAPPRGLGEILGVAADCVERCGAGAGTAGTAAPGRAGRATRDAADSAAPGAAQDDGAGNGAPIGSFAIPGLADLAGRRGTSQLVTQAARLMAAMRRADEHSWPKTAQNSS
ncbi:DUF6493 family protein [Streptomyces sp. NPDC051907]|uniref:DUF7824 domain-containing protein n=1 Tax=Streptomyces sp. NPDC051907 TaxID=3155284 RepID=UPI003441171C